MEYYKAQNFPFTIRNFITDEQCDSLVDFIQRKGDSYFKSSPIEYWNFRTIGVQVLKDEPEIREQLISIYKSVYPIVNSLTTCNNKLYADSLELVRWKEGEELQPHIDNAEPDGSPNTSPWRKLSVMLYLNDDFEGGEIYWSRLGLQLKPRKGMLVVFPSDAAFQHGVRKIDKGTRYTVSSFYSFDEQYNVEKAF